MADDVILPQWDYDVAPTTHQPVIRHDRDTGDREFTLMRWGLIPFFANSPEEFNDLSPILARAATLLQRPTWPLQATALPCPSWRLL